MMSITLINGQQSAQQRFAFGILMPSHAMQPQQQQFQLYPNFAQYM